MNLKHANMQCLDNEAMELHTHVRLTIAEMVYACKMAMGI